jgi:hypothetical protein
VWRFVAILLFGACRVADIDYSGKACPCPGGYVCATATNTCQRTLPIDGANSIDGAIDSSIDAAVVIGDPAFWFPLDQTSGADVPPMAPATAHGYIANPADVTWLPTGGKVGGALHFDANGGHSFVPFPADASGCSSPISLTGSFTASTWVTFERFQDWSGYTLSDVAIMQGTSGGTEGGWGIGATNGCGDITAAIEVASGANGTQRTTRCGSTVLGPNTWYFLTGVFDASARTLSIYVNGALDDGPFAVGSASVPTASYATTNCALLAASGQQGHLLLGALDEVRIYTRALTAAEVHALYLASGGT